jgi:hypothetical protein
MDIDIETLITLLFTIVFIALGALSNRGQKVKKVPELETEDEEERLQQESEAFTREVERLRGDYYEEERETLSDEISEPAFMHEDLTQESTNPERTADEQAVYSEPSESRRISSIKDYIKMSEMGQRAAEKPGISLTQKLKKEFNPRKAIRYMEIMRKKY